MVKFNEKKIAKKLKGIKGKKLVLLLNKLCTPKGKNWGLNYIIINEKLKECRISQTYLRLNKRQEKVMKQLGYKTNLDTRKKGSVLLLY